MTPDSAAPSSAPRTGYWIVGVLIVIGAAAVPFLRSQRATVRQEAQALRAEQATVGRTRDSLAEVVAQSRAVLEREQGRATARLEPKLHLVIAVDSGTVALVRDGLTLRTMPARFRGAAPRRGTQSIARIADAAPAPAAPTVDSLGNRIAAPTAERSVLRATLSDGTIIEGGDAAAALLGGVEVAQGPRMILVSRRDFAAIRPSLTRGMKAVVF